MTNTDDHSDHAGERAESDDHDDGASDGSPPGELPDEAGTVPEEGRAVATDTEAAAVSDAPADPVSDTGTASEASDASLDSAETDPTTADGSRPAGASGAGARTNTEADASAGGPDVDPSAVPDPSPEDGDESLGEIDLDLDEIVLDDEEGDPDEASRGLFDDLLSGEPIFENKEVLRPSYTPHAGTFCTSTRRLATRPTSAKRSISWT